ncbi:glycosyltransferase [Maribacter cobaltidurans]|uniref:Uncharacterized protein n=1 Tax=Maribacter cobaltidurans TaxID=1178778 RepID=A0A223V5Q7_9FLAO|nr:glycosyltransferase [Maribacter cobaltidurans]ASV30179.1 hypothetical protein CJ263_08070 [Maribacter cobaltidurans]GGD76436.1 hypothetical protein GCM10011412_12690 [Maribacter cobaltidurans]
MIFVTLGNQNFQFKRLLISIEGLINDGIISEPVVVQSGYTVYKSDLFISKKFLGKDEFNDYVKKAEYIISHAGTGSIISCLKQNKKVVVAARLQKYGEHIDNHQVEILQSFSDKNFIVGLNPELSDIENKIKSIDKINLNFFISNNDYFNRKLIEIIEGL